MTIKAVIGTNVERKTVLVDSASTIKETLESSGFDYTGRTFSLSGQSLLPDDLDKTFDELGVTDHCFLLSVKKADNAK